MATKRKPFEPKQQGAESGAHTLDQRLAGVREAESIDAPEVLTVNGKPIPPEFAHAITYAMTDQGIAEENRKPKLRATPGVSVTADAWDKTLQRKAESEVWEAFDPYQEAADSVREPGMSYRMISPRVLQRRGRRGWEPALDSEGKAVVVAGQSLGKMPTERAEKRNNHYRDQDQERLQHASEQYIEDQTRLIRDANVKGMAPLRVGDVLNDNHSHPGMRTEVGVRTARGVAAAE